MTGLAILAVIWIVGIVGAGMAEKTPEPIAAEEVGNAATEQGELELKKFRLDAMKALRESAFQRWDKRRLYEWQTSISIWTALAAFSVAILSGKAVIRHQIITALAAGVVGVLITWLHLHYVERISHHTIGDVQVQRIAEQEMYRLAYNEEMPGYSKASSGKPNDEYLCYPVMRIYGFPQCWITGLLAIAAVGVVLLAPPPPSGRADSSRTTPTTQSP
jgi:hypothetical protein